MPVRPLPPNPNLEHLKYQARDLLRDLAAVDSAAAQRIREFYPRWQGATDTEIFSAKLKLSDAQLTIARESGFPSWARLKSHIEKPTLADRLDLKHHERIEDPTFRHAVDLIDSGEVGGLRSYLKQHPNVVRQRVLFEGGNYFHNPSLLEFIAENPVRHGTMPPNIVEVTKAILDASPEQSAIDETLMLVATGSVARECGQQRSLIDLLCTRPANLNGALRAAAIHGEHASVAGLIERGAEVDLPVAAALGRTEEFRRLLPQANAEDRHLALALASQYGHVEVVRLLLDAGEDPNRYNPIGGHSHTTPLHQAAYSGPEELVRLLVERGARLNMKDVLWHGTPADWARHAGRTDIEAYLREQEGNRN